MFEATRYRYFLKPDKMGELKSQFYRLTCARNGDQQHLTKSQIIHFLLRQGLDVKLSSLTYFDKELFKQEHKSQYNCSETITMVDRLMVNPEIQKQYKKIFKIFDINNKDKLTALDLKRTMNHCNKKSPDDRQIQQIFNDLDIDQDGLVSYEDFLCAMISK